MKKIIYNLINKLGYRIERKSRTNQENLLYLNKFGITDNSNTLIRSRKFILSLDEKFKNVSIKNHKDGFLVSFLNLTIYVESAEEFFILNEVFVEKDYNFFSNSKSIVIDIGANIGISSMFFSTLDYVEKIYAFEPVKDSFDQAQYNFKLNETIQKVERIKNIGLGNGSKKEMFLFDKNLKGNTGIKQSHRAGHLKNDNAVEREVQIADATIEISEILNDSKGRKVIIKMDCEGAEYEIFENICKSGIINQIDIIMLEWHDRGSEIIEELLISAEFELFSRNLSPISGIIYAFKNK